MFQLAKHPEVQEKLYQEIKRELPNKVNTSFFFRELFCNPASIDAPFIVRSWFTSFPNLLCTTPYNFQPYLSCECLSSTQPLLLLNPDTLRCKNSPNKKIFWKKGVFYTGFKPVTTKTVYFMGLPTYKETKKTRHKNSWWICHLYDLDCVDDQHSHGKSVGNIIW